MRRVFQRIPPASRPAMMFERIKGHRMPLVAGVLGASLCYRRSKGGVVPGGRTSERPSTGGDYVKRPPTDGAARAEPHLTPLVRATLRRRRIR